jgi:hypothetical protein
MVSVNWLAFPIRLKTGHPRNAAYASFNLSRAASTASCIANTAVPEYSTASFDSRMARAFSSIALSAIRRDRSIRESVPSESTVSILFDAQWPASLLFLCLHFCSFSSVPSSLIGQRIGDTYERPPHRRHSLNCLLKPDGLAALFQA